MKKYGKSLLIVAVIVFGIGTFYMQSALSASKYPDFKLRKLNGDEAEVEPVVIDGVYSLGSMNPINERLQLTAEGSHYSREASYVEDRKSTRLNSSHVAISYAVFCLKKKRSDGYGATRVPTTHLMPHRVAAA